MNKADFFTYHRNIADKIIFYYAGNSVIMTARQFDKLDNVIITISGIDYSIAETCNKL